MNLSDDLKTIQEVDPGDTLVKVSDGSKWKVESAGLLEISVVSHFGFRMDLNDRTINLFRKVL